MQASFKSRLARLEAAHQPPAREWTIGVDIVAYWLPDGGRQRVVGHIPARPIEPGEPFNYRRAIEELAEAMGDIDDSLIDWSREL